MSRLVYLDCEKTSEKRKSFTFEHASRLIKYEYERGMKNWSLSEGQNYTVINGILTERKRNQVNKDESGA